MTPTYESIGTSEEANSLTIRYSFSNRINLLVVVIMLAAVMGFNTLILYGNRPHLLSGEWPFVPLCLFGYAGLFASVYGSGLFRSPLHIHADGAVQQGIWTWRFPGPMRAESRTIRGKTTTYQLLLRYGATELRFAGGESESSTLSVAAAANLWIASRIHGARETSNDQAGLPKNSGPLWFGMGVVCGTLMLEAIAHGSQYYLNDAAPYGVWAHACAAACAVLGVALLVRRLMKMSASEVKVSASVWLTESVIAALMILGTVAIGAHDAQRLEMISRPMVASVVDQPLVMTRTTSGKGCHRYLVLQEPAINTTIRYCDPEYIDYWRGASGVRVHQSSNVYGVHIDSVERLPAD